MKETSDYRPILIEIFTELNKPAGNWDSYYQRCKGWVEKLLRESYSLVSKEIEGPILKASERLTRRQQDLIIYRYNHNLDLETIGKRLGNITKERVRQIELKALYKLGASPYLESLEKPSLRVGTYLYGKILQELPEGKEYLVPLCKTLLYPALRKERREKLREEKIERHRLFIESLRGLSREEKEWLTGFWEGDGSLGPGPSVGFDQKDSRILSYIVELFKGNRPIYSDGNQMHGLAFNLTESRHLLPMLCENLVCQNRIEQIRKVSRLDNLGLNPVGHKPTIPWIAGFFDAEGCVYNMSFSQKDTKVLESIQEVLGGHISSSSLYLRKAEVLKFLPLWLKFSHNPRKQEDLNKTCPQRDKEKSRAYCREYYQKNKERYKESSQRRKALISLFNQHARQLVEEK